MMCAAAALTTPTPPVRHGLRRIPQSLPRFSPPSPLPSLHTSTVNPRLSVSTSLILPVPMAASAKETIENIDAEMVDEYTSQAKLLQEFTNISSIDNAWVFRSDSGSGSQAMFSISQANLLANTKKTLVLSSYLSEDRNQSTKFHWSPFPVEMIGVSTIVPSPSGSKLLVVRNKENSSPTQLEIWGHSKLEKEIHIPHSVHGSIFTDKWFEGISWNNEENLIAYVAEEQPPSKPTFDDSGFKKEGNSDKDCGRWKGEGDWEEHWGETYVGKRKPTLFVVNTESGEVRAVKGITKSLSVGQVVWAPSSLDSSHRYLVFVGWKSQNDEKRSPRKFGMKYCYNRPCALYTIKSPFEESHSCTRPSGSNVTEDSISMVNLTSSLSSAFFPRFSPDGKSLVFLSAKSAVDSGAHSATNSLHRMDWPEGEISSSPSSIYDVVPVVMCAKDVCFPGLYCPSILSNPWLSDGCTMVLCSIWGSIQVIISINVFSCKILRVTPADSFDSWNVLALVEDNLIAVSSNPVDPPQIKYGRAVNHKEQADAVVVWDWLDVSSPLPGCSEKVLSLLSSLKFNIIKIPICDGPGNLTEGARKPIEAIFVSSSDSQTKETCKENPLIVSHDACNPLIVILHGGPHSVSLSSYSKSSAFLAALGYNLLIVNYRGSLGFGEEALQSLPGKIGSQDVNDVLAAMDHIIEMRLADPSKIAVLGGSHGGFLTTHLIGQASERFKVAAVRNPVCNLSLMVGTSDIPDWVYAEAYGTEGTNSFTEAPSMEHLNHFFAKSPISHLSKVKAPTLFLLGAQDLRVPVSNGLQYARALKEKGAEVKVIVFPNDTHGIERPQSDFESFLNIGVWFKKFCK